MLRIIKENQETSIPCVTADVIMDDDEIMYAFDMRAYSGALSEKLADGFRGCAVVYCNPEDIGQVFGQAKFDEEGGPSLLDMYGPAILFDTYAEYCEYINHNVVVS